MTSQPNKIANSMPADKASSKKQDQKVDEAMEETFPASDPPAHTGITGPSGDMQASPR